MAIKKAVRLKVSVIGVLLGALAVLSGCATAGAPTRTEMLGTDTYLVLGSYTDEAGSVAALRKKMQESADRQCPGGWSELAHGPNPHAEMGGRIWKIHCTGSAAGARPLADSGAAVAGDDDVLHVLAVAAQKASPGLSPTEAEAIAKAQLKALTDSGIIRTGPAEGAKPKP